MEALDGHNRPSGIHSVIKREKIERINTDRPYPSATMATTAVVSPTSSMYSNPPPPYSSGWPPPSAHPGSGLISPPDSRRTSDNKTEPPPTLQTAPPPHRQSLPSIHEALSSGPKPNPYASPVSASLPPHQLPFSQSQGPSIPRSYPPSDHAPYPTHSAPQPRQPSPPQPVQPQSNPFSRPEQGSFSEAPRHSSLNTLQPAPAPHNPYAGPSRHEPLRYEPEQRAPERPTNGYTHHPPPPQQGSYTYGPPPNEMPPSGPPAPTYNQPRYQPRDEQEMGDWKGQGEKELVSFKHGLKRHLDVYDFENTLSIINEASGSLQEWSGYYHAIAQEQQRSVNVIPDRMPDLESCMQMMRQQQRISDCLQRMRDMIEAQEHAAQQDQRMRDLGARGPGAYDDEMSMYGDGMKNQIFGGSDAKKRRGRAAPPGRCHSCNRAETPEWRRGPDGARTLCNACGLHYAKLTRKQATMKQSQGSNGSNLRPKSLDEGDQRSM